MLNGDEGLERKYRFPNPYFNSQCCAMLCSIALCLPSIQSPEVKSISLYDRYIARDHMLGQAERSREASKSSDSSRFAVIALNKRKSCELMV